MSQAAAFPSWIGDIAIGTALLLAAAVLFGMGERSRTESRLLGWTCGAIAAVGLVHLATGLLPSPGADKAVEIVAALMAVAGATLVLLRSTALPGPQAIREPDGARPPRRGGGDQPRPAAVDAAGLRELTEAKERFEIALAGSRISVSTQDAKLRYRWVFNPRFHLSPEDMIGRTDEDLYDPAVATHLRKVKFGVMNTGQPATTDIEMADASRRKMWLRLHITPCRIPDGEPDGVMCVCIDVTEERRRADMLEHVTQALAEANARFDTALAGSNITMFRQDRDLRYIWMHNPPPGLTGDHFIGRNDEETLPEDSARLLAPVKRRVLDTGEPCRIEMSMRVLGSAHWFDMRIEPFFERGRIAGIMCVAIDITDQKEYQQQLKVVMRELTHRSKNLLAVVQGIARQTAQTVEDLPAFVDRFGARLQALARAHDILVDESWRGASIDELVSTQLSHVLEDADGRLDERGHRVMLKPEAAQNVALALHELATNAAKYGALSTEDGRVSVGWSLTPSDGSANGAPVLFEITWQERGGPPVEEPKRRGFGRMMIERLVPRAIDGTSELIFDPSGIRWTLRFPSAYLAEADKGVHGPRRDVD